MPMFDIYFLLFCLPAMIAAAACQIWVKSAYRKQSLVRNFRGMTGAQAAAAVLRHYGVSNVQIRPIAGSLTDHFDPRDNTINLSQGVYGSASVAAVGIACHEAGHAAQHAAGYIPIKIRNAILPVSNIGSLAGVPLAILGFIMGFQPLVTIGLILFAMVAVFQLVTLPVEFNASRRAMRVIEEDGLLEGEEAQGARKVLTAAAMTYVAALAVSIANLLRLLVRMHRRS
ncbi:MAG: zinc metallopeptidase [Oscillospiraceae bacterium]|jgi:Zn-dependent membrane protease YugP|nr:zinc metallopeptidase [Oscillospiraceae bacterium]